MNREIKFRGKVTESFTGLSLKKGDWIYGSLVDDSKHGGKVYISWWYEDGDRYVLTEVEPNTVGLLVYKHKDFELYEDDIIEVDYKGTEEYDDNLITVVQAKGEVEIWGYDHETTLYEWAIDYDSKIIGNIHDNPELLKGGNQ